MEITILLFIIYYLEYLFKLLLANKNVIIEYHIMIYNIYTIYICLEEYLNYTYLKRNRPEIFEIFQTIK